MLNVQLPAAPRFRKITELRTVARPLVDKVRLCVARVMVDDGATLGTDCAAKTVPEVSWMTSAPRVGPAGQLPEMIWVNSDAVLVSPTVATMRE